MQLTVAASFFNNNGSHSHTLLRTSEQFEVLRWDEINVKLLTQQVVS